MKTKLHYVFSITLFFALFSVRAQDNYWTTTDYKQRNQNTSLKNLEPKYYRTFQLDVNALKQQLQGAPLRGNFSGQSNTIVLFPDETGSLERFRVVEAPVLSKELSLLHPEIKTYLGFGVDSPGARVRFSVTPRGIKSMTSFTNKGMVLSQPLHPDTTSQYLVYSRNAARNIEKDFECLTEDTIAPRTRNATFRDANDQTLRTFRIAISTSGEYTNSVEGGGSQTSALAAVVATLNRSNEVFEVDMAITFTLVSGTSLIFPNSATDPYRVNGDGLTTLNAELQNELTTNFGEANYDIGHLLDFGTNNGNAGCIGCVCDDGQKGSGFSSHTFLDNDGGPYMSDFFDIDYVPHEIGHQMGANHTHSEADNTPVNYEPGSGTTIMGYAGITSSDVQDHSDPYFHYGSISQVLGNPNVSSGCATTSGISNAPPLADAGSDYNIPQGTAFILKGAATDPNTGDNLTYTWEQIDDGMVSSGDFGPTNTSGPLWRSRPPSTSPDRYMPVLSRVIAGQLTESNPVETVDNTSWETVSTVARDLTFALIVRDRSEAGGTGQTPQSDFDTMVVSVESVTPFTVNDPQVWSPNSSQNVTWNFGQTDLAPINCQNVNIKLSTDGGLTYPFNLALNTPNDGSENITVPNIGNTTTARLLVEAADNIFYAISNPDFSIDNSPDFSITNTNGDQSPPCGSDTADYDFSFNALNGFSENTVFTTSNIPAGASASITPDNLTGSGSFAIQLSDLSTIASGNYSFTVTGTSASITKDVMVGLTIAGVCPSVANTDFETSTTLVNFNTINNPSGKPAGYNDYTGISTDVNIDSSYDLTVNANTDGNFTTFTRVWIDWNQDCDFDDAQEEYDLGTSNNVANGATSNSPLSITIPSFAVLGNTIMRVSTKYNAAPTSCENGADAEVEDYTLNVEATLSTGNVGFDEFSIFPNPNNGQFTVKFSSGSNNDITINLNDLRGRVVYSRVFSETTEFNQTIDMKTLQSGIYLLQVSDGARIEGKKVIIR